MLRHYDAFVNYMITYGVFHIQLLLQSLQRMLCDGQLLSSPLFPALPCRGPVSLWLSTELREMEVISFSSCVPLKHELLGNWTSSQISAQISLELPCDKMQKGLSHFRLHGWSSCNSCIYCNICLNLTPNIAWSYSVSLQQSLRGWEVENGHLVYKGSVWSLLQKSFEMQQALNTHPWMGSRL